MIKPIRVFETGASRDNDDDKYDYEGFLSHRVISRYGAYMHKNRVMADGSVRDSDNWQKGIPRASAMKSAWRHLVAWWTLHRRGAPVGPVANDPMVNLEEAICAVIFNASSYLDSILKEHEEDVL